MVQTKIPVHPAIAIEADTGPAPKALCSMSGKRGPQALPFV